MSVFACVLHEALTLEREGRGIREEDGSALLEGVGAGVWVCVCVSRFLRVQRKDRRAAELTTLLFFDWLAHAGHTAHRHPRCMCNNKVDHRLVNCQHYPPGNLRGGGNEEV